MRMTMDNTDRIGALPTSARPKSQMYRSSSLTSLQQIKNKISGLKDRGRIHQPTIGEELEVVELDRIIKTEPSDNKHRRTIILKRQEGSWGFTLQSYGVQVRQTGDTDLLTFVDYVDLSGAAHHAGMRSGDVILSINGMSMETASHASIVNYIKACGDTMRMVVLFEDCVQKVEMHLRYLRLRRVLMEKMFEMRALEKQEAKILAGRSKEPARLSMYDSGSSFDLEYDTLSLKPEFEDSPGPFTPNSASSTSSNSSVFFSARNSFENRSLPAGARQRPKSMVIHHSVTTEPGDLGTGEKRPLSCIIENKSEGTAFDAAGLKRRQLNSSVTGEVSFVRERSAPSSFPLLPPNFPLASAENPLRNTPFLPASEYSLPPPRRASIRRSNRRYSFKERRTHGVHCRTACPHNKLCADHVVTEENSRRDSDPQLLWLKHFEQNPTVKLRSFSDNSALRTQEVHRKIINSTSVGGLCNMMNHCEDAGDLRTPVLSSEDEGDADCDMSPVDEVESKWSDIENLSNTLSQTSISNGDAHASTSAMNESLESNVFEEGGPGETYGAKFSFAQFLDTPCDSSTPHKGSEKRRRSKVRTQETPCGGDIQTDIFDGEVEMSEPAQGRQLMYVNESEETTKL